MEITNYDSKFVIDDFKMSVIRRMLISDVVEFIDKIDFKPTNDKVLVDLDNEIISVVDCDKKLEGKVIRDNVIDTVIIKLIYYIPVGLIIKNKEYIKNWIIKFTDNVVQCFE